MSEWNAGPCGTRARGLGTQVPVVLVTNIYEGPLALVVVATERWPQRL